MSGIDSGGFRFVSHQRRGLVALPGVADSGTVAGSAILSDGSTTTPVTLKLASVGDIQALDTTLVTRMYPRAGTTDAETEFFPLVEFGAPELPWLLPGPHDSRGPLPWLCLVAVEARDGVSVTPAGAGRLDVLHIGDPARPSEELPDPAQATLWTHAFVATTVSTEGSADPTELPNGPGLTTCRFLAPRRLEAQKSYIACLVPTLAAASLAGLGRPDTEIQAALAAPQPNFAWSTTDTSVDLPVYLQWEFSCGETGDFESLARSLHEVPVDPTFGTRPVDLGLAGAGMPATTSLKTVFRGALTAPGIAAQTGWPDPSDPDQENVDESLTGEIAAAAALAEAAAAAHPAGRPAIGPLLYARAAAGRGDVTTAGSATDWFDQLNRDPRARGVAGLGTRVLRRTVEDVMAKAWQQVGEVEAANAALRRLQVSRAVTASLHERHLSALSPGRLMTTARPLLGRVSLPAAVTGGTQTSDALAAVADSALPAGSTWRGLGTALRPGSRLGEAAAPQDASGSMLTRLVAGIDEPDVLPDGTVGLAAPSAVFGQAAAALMSDAVRLAASAAGLAAPAPDANAAAVVTALDGLAAGAEKLSTAASANLAAETGAVVRERALPESVLFSALGGVLVSGDIIRAKAQDGPVLVHTAPIHSVAPVTTVVHPAVSKPLLEATTQPLTALVSAAKTIQETTPVTPAGRLTGGAPSLETTPVVVELMSTDARLQVMRTAYAQAVDRFIRPGTATSAPAAGALDLAAAKTALLAHLDPATTVATLAAARVPALAGLVRPDPVAPVMAGPVFGDPAYLDLVGASHDAFVPGLDSVPPDSVTLVQTNPTFIAAYLAGLNSALGHELLWRGYPTDERGTYWYSFWGAGPDIRALHTFVGGLADNVTEGTQPLLVLILRGRLLKRYPDSDIYVVEAGTDKDLPELDGAGITRPLFRDFVDPDITLVGFQLTYEQVVGASGGNGYWFVIAEHPGQPRFGLIDPDPAVPHPPLPTWDELSWADLGPAAMAATYVPAAAPPMSPSGTSRVWAATAADMAAITYQPAVRVAIRGTDLLRRPT